MKRFRLLEAADPSVDQNKEPERWKQSTLEYVDLIKQVVRLPLDRMRGATMEEMRQGIRILDALEGKGTGDIFELEDADHAHLVAKVKAFPWAFVDRRLLEFCATVENATGSVLDETPAQPTEAPPTPAQNGAVAAV